MVIVCYNVSFITLLKGNAFISCTTSAFFFSKYCMSLLCDNFGNKFAMNERILMKRRAHKGGGHLDIVVCHCVGDLSMGANYIY